MLKKFTAIVFLSVAYAIMLGHSIIPHHHHDNNHELTAHHLTSHHHDEDEQSNDLSHLFSHFIHAADGFVTTVNYTLGNTFFRQLVALIILPDNFCFDKILIPPLLHNSAELNFNYTFFSSCTFGLRAPPAFAII